LKSNHNILFFLGIADHFDESVQPYPFGGLDLYQLSKHKLHIIYPGIIRTNHWVILISHQFLRDVDLSQLSIRICDEEDKELGTLKFPVVEWKAISDLPKEKRIDENIIIIQEEGSEYALIHFKLDVTILQPGRYRVQTILNGAAQDIGSVEFHYKKAAALTPDQIMAIESTANIKALRMEFGCKFCPSKLNVYTGIKRSSDLEEQGCIWYSEAADEFRCECGKTVFSLDYIRESMHGLLINTDVSTSGLSYVRRHGIQQVANVVNNFNRLLISEKQEEPIQKFIEENPMLLARFSAKRLFAKPTIIGRFVADFAILDSKNHLWFLELERPSLPLFKKDGHPTANLMHPFEQVNDWLQQYSKYPNAILESLNLKETDVVAVHGAVIAGRKRSVSVDLLQRFLLNPPYPKIEFLTFEDLGESLLTISREIT
jgi:hypothetical protein